ncbi:MAG: hypothetical protein VKN13_05270 [Cyanobacteriota bacterium]|nr:hypothetical protein [Cyanobacteriota bacterium]
MAVPAEVLQPVTWQLPGKLVERIQALAKLEGIAEDNLVQDILAAGITEAGLTTSGRCSVRTGLCSEGPQPLPMQQL